jgi:hypothetical protein
MSGRGRPTFNKRQKEQKRKEKQQEKASRREERKLTSEPLKDEETIAMEALAELAAAQEEARLAALEAAQMPLSSSDPLAMLERQRED